ncbi:MAG: hypothetical protein SOU27_06565 [Sodaliphilus sp.]|nr:hypothetical protein [Sodaliphilus sp.]
MMKKTEQNVFSVARVDFFFFTFVADFRLDRLAAIFGGGKLFDHELMSVLT